MRSRMKRIREQCSQEDGECSASQEKNAQKTGMKREQTWNDVDTSNEAIIEESVADSLSLLHAVGSDKRHAKPAFLCVILSVGLASRPCTSAAIIVAHAPMNLHTTQSCSRAANSQPRCNPPCQP
ncbi:hypothetical protein QOT17_016657 [Balamuthia mandrillaris]